MIELTEPDAPGHPLPDDLAARLDALRAIVAALGGAVVAYSGGVDSTLLAFVAREQLGANAIACTAASPSIPDEELAAATELAARLGLRHRVVRTRELENADYVSNSPDRCYVCKGILFVRLAEVAREEGVSWLLYGGNTDDESDYRPGSRAATEMGARAPLAEAGLGKADVRDLARFFGLPNAEKPAAACLSSRVPYGQPVTIEKLRQVGAAERALRGLGFPELRVRHHGPVARIEIPLRDLSRAVEPETRTGIVRELTALGFTYVTVDLKGFRSGSLNEVLAGGTPSAGIRPDPPATE